MTGKGMPHASVTIGGTPAISVDVVSRQSRYTDPAPVGPVETGRPEAGLQRRDRGGAGAIVSGAVELMVRKETSSPPPRA
jgi:hypothetical protein